MANCCQPTINPDGPQKSSIAKPTKVKEWWVVLITIAIAAVIFHILFIPTQHTAFSSRGSLFHLVLFFACMAIYPVVKSVLRSCIDG